MRGAAIVVGVIGALAFAGWIVMAAFGMQVMPSYLAAWLFWLAIPVGALPLVMGLEFAGAGLTPLATALRPLLLLMPVAAVFVIPVLVRIGPLYPWAATPQHGMAATWFSTAFFVVRAILYLIVWTGLALAFARRPSRLEGRRGLAAFGLGLHLAVGTLAATDWALSLDLSLGSSEFGFLVIAAQCSLALAAALLVNPAAWRDPALLTQFAWLTLALLGAWVFLQFTQFLVVWSADLPREIVWYQRRDGGLGFAVEWFGFSVAALALLLLAPLSLARRLPGMVAALAGLILLMHLFEMLWLVTPNFRGHFAITFADVLAMAGIGGLVLAATQALRGRELPHGHA
ncbi:MAG: hypothetical protein JO157_07135 [Acetobacteraceae bacterium]|nr:hypothetical protein [Acetobacteraceae bacterium]